MRRVGFLASLLSVIPVAAFADRLSEKRAFISQCDESISLERLAGAPHKFVGKKVDVHGMVGPATDTTDAFNMDSLDNGLVFVVVIGDARSLEQGQRVRVLGVVDKPVSGENNMGGGGTYATIRARFIS